MYEYVIFGLPVGENRPYMEEVIFEKIKNKEQAQRIAKICKDRGYHSVRVAEIKLNGLPDFHNTIS